MLKWVLFGLGGLVGSVVAVQAAMIALCGAVGLIATDNPAEFVLACVGVTFLAREVYRFCDGRVEAMLDAEYAARAARFKAEMDAKAAASEAGQRAADEARAKADAAWVAEVFGGLETVASGETDGSLFDLPEPVTVDAAR